MEFFEVRRMSQCGVQQDIFEGQTGVMLVLPSRILSITPTYPFEVQYDLGCESCRIPVARELPDCHERGVS